MSPFTKILADNQKELLKMINHQKDIYFSKYGKL